MILFQNYFETCLILTGSGLAADNDSGAWWKIAAMTDDDEQTELYNNKIDFFIYFKLYPRQEIKLHTLKSK